MSERHHRSERTSWLIGLAAGTAIGAWGKRNFSARMSRRGADFATGAGSPDRAVATSEVTGGVPEDMNAMPVALSPSPS